MNVGNALLELHKWVLDQQQDAEQLLTGTRGRSAQVACKVRAQAMNDVADKMRELLVTDTETQQQ